MTLNIYQRINEVRKKVSYVIKDGEVSTGKSKYKAVTHDAVTAILRSHLIEQGIITRQTLKTTKTDDAGVTKFGTVQKMVDNVYQIDFINCDDPNDLMSIEVQAQSIDTSDKSPGKAMSYAMKYALLKTFNIETGENEESRQEMYERKQQQIELTKNKQVKALEALIDSTGSDMEKLLSHYNVESLEAMNQVQIADLNNQLKRKQEKQGKEQSE